MTMPPELWLFLLRAEYRLAPRWQRRTALFLAAVLTVSVLAAVAVAAPGGGCRAWVASAAGRPHLVCAEAAP